MCRICGKETIHERMGMGRECAKKFALELLPSLNISNVIKSDIPILKIEHLEKFTALEVIKEELEEVGLDSDNLGEFISGLSYDENDVDRGGGKRCQILFEQMKKFGIIPSDSVIAGASPAFIVTSLNLGIIAFYPHSDPRPGDHMVFVNIFDLSDNENGEEFIPFFREYGIITDKNIMFIHNGSYVGNYHLGKNNYFFNNNDTAALEETIKKVRERNLGEKDYSKDPYYYFESEEKINEYRSKVAGFVFFRNFVRINENNMTTLQKGLNKSKNLDENSSIDLSYSNITMIRQAYIHHIFKKKEEGLSEMEIEAIQHSFDIPVIKTCFTKEEIDLVCEYLQSDGGESFYYQIIQTGKK